MRFSRFYYAAESRVGGTRPVWERLHTTNCVKGKDRWLTPQNGEGPQLSLRAFMVELSGVEPLTYCMPCNRSTS